MLRVSAGFVAAACALLASVGAALGHADKDAKRARLAYGSMERIYLDRRSGDFRESPRGRPGSHAWPFSQALAATIEMVRVRGAGSAAARAVPRRLRKLDDRFRVHGVYHAAPGGAVYYDDNEWIAQDLLDWNDARSSPAARRKAARIFQAVTRAWDGSTRKTCPGGVQWTNARGNDDRNTVSTANGAVVGLRLYLLTHRASYLRWSRRMVGWVERCLHDPDGLYADHVSGDGSIDRTEWSYNQGSMLAAYRLLYRATGDRSDLARAEAIGDASLTRFRGRWSREPAAFGAIFFRRLLELAAVDRRSDYVAAARRYAAHLWAKPRRQLFEQAAVVQMYAALATTRGGA
ncbi:MAG TPA: glycoside hydrolase family 76 protein [Gaiellaceae bacterium]